VLDDAKDIPWRDAVIPGFAVPREFWKLVLRVENDALLATALCADQLPLIDRLPEARASSFSDLSKVEKYQISIVELERKTGLDFGQAVRDADTAVPAAEARRAPLQSIKEVSLDRGRPETVSGSGSRRSSSARSGPARSGREGRRKPR
jgi:endonuclease G